MSKFWLKTLKSYTAFVSATIIAFMMHVQQEMKGFFVTFGSINGRTVTFVVFGTQRKCTKKVVG